MYIYTYMYAHKAHKYAAFYGDIKFICVLSERNVTQISATLHVRTFVDSISQFFRAEFDYMSIAFRFVNANLLSANVASFVFNDFR